MPPPEYCNTEACDQGDCLEADLYPVPDRGGISLGNPARGVDAAQPAGEDAAARGLPRRRLHRDATGRREERAVQADEVTDITGAL